LINASLQNIGITTGMGGLNMLQTPDAGQQFFQTNPNNAGGPPSLHH
jgi:hypothetical protein